MEVSVIIPSYNAAAFLGDAIDSVLNQTYRDFEVLVIDDGSTDDTEAIVRGYGHPVRYFRQPNSGVAAARNRGIEESRGRYLAFLDADDTWFPRKLELQLEALKQRPECAACDGAYTVVASDLSPIRAAGGGRSGRTFESLLLKGNVVWISTVLCEKSLFDRAGGFDPALSQCADWDMWVRIAALTDFFYIEEPLAAYRQHGSNMSRNAPLLERDSVRVLEKGFAMAGLADSLKSERRRAMARNYMVLAGTYFQAHQYRDFIRCAFRAVAMDFRRAGYLVGFPVRALGRRGASDPV